MKVLVACEESQAVCLEFRKIGHEAYSCDLQECSGGHPEWHIKADAREAMKLHWDLIIAHPPCTYLSRAGATHLFDRAGRIINIDRYMKGMDGAAFFRMFLNADCEKVAIENPTPLKIFGLPKWTQTIEPYMFGEPWRKRTRLWLKGLEPLKPTKIVKPVGLWCGVTTATQDENYEYKMNNVRSGKLRAKTFHGIARAMAEQWGGIYGPWISIRRTANRSKS